MQPRISDLFPGVLAFIKARWKESGGHGATPLLPATVEDTYHAIRIISTLEAMKAQSLPDFRQDQGLKSYLSRVKETAWVGARTTFQVLFSCRLAGVAVDVEESAKFVANRLATTQDLGERYYCARIVREVLGKPTIPGMEGLDGLPFGSWRVASELWMIMYLMIGQRGGQNFACRGDLIAWLVACQNYDGGFGFLPGSTSYIENCHTCLQALALLDAAPQNPTAAQAFVVGVQYKKVTPIKLPTASPQLYCYQTYFSLSPILSGKHFSTYLSGLMTAKRLYSQRVPASKTILSP